MKILTSWSPASEYERCCSSLFTKFQNSNNKVTLFIIQMKILTAWYPADECKICRSLLLKKLKNINNQVTLLINNMRILTLWFPKMRMQDVVVCY